MGLMGQINWGKLREQNRVKEVGIPWTDEEAYAVFTLKVPADSVRRGALTIEAHEKLINGDEVQIKKTGMVYTRYLPKARLLKLCAEYGVPATEEASNQVLIEALLKAGAPKKVPAE